MRRPNVEIIVESAVTGLGLDEIRGRIGPGVTAALLGGSGVGKSTLVNRLLGVEAQETRAVRESDDKGRHTTVAREMVLLPGGGVLIDTPGMRGIALWDAERRHRECLPRHRRARRAGATSETARTLRSRDARSSRRSRAGHCRSGGSRATGSCKPS